MGSPWERGVLMDSQHREGTFYRSLLSKGVLCSWPSRVWQELGTLHPPGSHFPVCLLMFHLELVLK